MKKILLILGFTLILCGCAQSKIVCTGKYDNSGIKYSIKTTAKLKNDKVKSIKSVLSFDSEEEAQEYCEDIKRYVNTSSSKISYDCSNKKIELNTLEPIISISNSTLLGTSKENFIEIVEADNLVKMECK